MVDGRWVLLQNVHLGLSFLPELEEMLAEKSGDDDAAKGVHDGFRLFLTTLPSDAIPLTLLQLSIKVSVEAPAGVREGLRRSFASLTQENYGMVAGASQVTWQRILYSICFFHAILQERRKFGPLGFSQAYAFSQADLTASVHVTASHLNDADANRRPPNWDYICRMLCRVQYGGRVHNEYDQRIVDAYGQNWIVEGAATDEEFLFAVGYALPPPGSGLEACRAHIEALESHELPELFGLHTNAGLAVLSKQTFAILTTMSDMSQTAAAASDIGVSEQQQADSGGGESREAAVLRIIDELEGRLPYPRKAVAVSHALRALGGLSQPLNVCLSQEHERMVRVLKTLRSEMDSLRLAIAGTIMMNSKHSSSISSLYNTRVPQAWVKLAQFNMQSVSVWLGVLVKQDEQWGAWLAHGRPKIFWLAGFTNPSGLLMANRQEVCRRHAKEGWALDDMVNATTVLSRERHEVRQPPDEGICLHGLVLEGCRWDKPTGMLAEYEPLSKELHAPMPVVHVTGVLSAKSKEEEPYSLAVPCYRHTERGLHTSGAGAPFVGSFSLRSGVPPEKWILRGVCLLVHGEFFLRADA